MTEKANIVTLFNDEEGEGALYLNGVLDLVAHPEEIIVAAEEKVGLTSYCLTVEDPNEILNDRYLKHDIDSVVALHQGDNVIDLTAEDAEDLDLVLVCTDNKANSSIFLHYLRGDLIDSGDYTDYENEFLPRRGVDVIYTTKYADLPEYADQPIYTPFPDYLNEVEQD